MRTSTVGRGVPPAVTPLAAAARAMANSGERIDWGGPFGGNDDPEWHAMMDVVAEESRKAYRKLIYETPEFYDYFRTATPIDIIAPVCVVMTVRLGR